MSRALDLLGGLVTDNGAPWAQRATAWQWADAKNVLEGPQRFSYLVRPRGASKTTDLAAMAIVALIEQLPERARAYGAASDREQAALLLDSIQGFVLRTPGLEGLLKIEKWKVTALRTGATLDILAADAAGTWGLMPHFVIVDERAAWKTTNEPEGFWRALFSAMPKVANSRLVILTMAGDPAHPAGKLLARARASTWWYVDEVPGPCPWVSEEDLAEQRAELPEWEYRRLHLAEWVESADRLTTVDDLAECVVLDGPLRHDDRWPYVVAVDLGLSSDRAVTAVCHAEPITGASDSVTGTRVVLDRMGVWEGSRREPVQLSEVEEWLVEATLAYGRPEIVFDPWQAAGMVQRLKARGLSVNEFTFNATSVGRLGSTLHVLIRSHNLALPDDADLIDELANVRLREVSPGSVRMDHDTGRHDDRAIALGLAAHHLLNNPRRGPIFLGAA